MAGTDWKKQRTDMGISMNEMSRLSPEAVEACSIMTRAGEGTGNLDSKTRALIASAIATQLRCDGCISIYTEEARKAGATREEIAEALGVALAVTARVALVATSRAIEAYGSAVQS